MFKKSIFKNINFMKLLSALLVTKIGDYLLAFALSWYIYDITGSTIALSLSLISTFIPNALVSIFSGIIADKYDRKKIIVICDVLSGILTFMLFLISINMKLSLYMIVIFNVLLSIISAMFSPSISAAIQSSLAKKELQDASALTQLQGRFAFIVGTALGGLILKSLGIEILLLLNAISFLISATIEFFTNIKQLEQSSKLSVIKNLKEAGDFLAKNKIILFITLFAGIIANGTFMSIEVYMPSIFKDVLEKSSIELGTYYSIEGTVAAITSLYFVFSNHKLNPYLWTLLTLVFQGLVLLSIGIMNNLLIAYFIGMVAGFSFAICSITTTTLIRMLVSNDIMGRIGSFNMFLSNISIPVFTIIYGLLGEYFKNQNIIIISSVVFLIAMAPAPLLFFKSKENIELRNR